MDNKGLAQVPFSSINFGTDTSEEGRLVIKNFLLATEAGLGYGETPIFPISIFKVKEGVNYNPEDKNYDLFKLAMRVSSKRLFPNFSFLDAPFNLQYYKKGKPETEIAYMGALGAKEHIYIKINGDVFDISIKDFYEYIKTGVLKNHRMCHSGNHTVIPEIKTHNGGSSGVYSITHKIQDLRYIGSSSNIDRRFGEHRYRIQKYGKIDGGFDFKDTHLANYSFKVVEYCDNFEEREKHYIQNVENVNMRGILKAHYKNVTAHPSLFKGRKIPNFRYDDTMPDFIDLRDRDIHVLDRDNKFTKILNIHKNFASNSKRMLFFYYYENGKMRQFNCTEDHPMLIGNEFKRADEIKVGECFVGVDNKDIEIVDIIWAHKKLDNYDIETMTGTFIASDLISHNCRTRVMSNIYDTNNEQVYGRGNLSFTSINLPRLAIESKGNIKDFYARLKDKTQLVVNQLKERFHIQQEKTVKNFPFLMGQGIWTKSKGLKPNDKVGEVLKHGTLSVGFIGLAEALTSLVGKHHGESTESQKLGLEIISFIRKHLDKVAKKEKLNYSLIATPAEGLSGRFVEMDKKKFGIIKGVTDKEYYTNSFHIPVGFEIPAHRKISLEAPYHALTNAGHITYVELDGDISHNLPAFEKVIRHMKESGVGYGSVNHPVDRDPVCGYVGVIGKTCPKCLREEGSDGMGFERVRRISGYLVGTLDRFNKAKLAEVRDRLKHNV